MMLLDSSVQRACTESLTTVPATTGDDTELRLALMLWAPVILRCSQVVGAMPYAAAGAANADAIGDEKVDEG